MNSFKFFFIIINKKIKKRYNKNIKLKSKTVLYYKNKIIKITHNNKLI